MESAHRLRGECHAEQDKFVACSDGDSFLLWAIARKLKAWAGFLDDSEETQAALVFRNLQPFSRRFLRFVGRCQTQLL